MIEWIVHRHAGALSWQISSKGCLKLCRKGHSLRFVELVDLSSGSQAKPLRWVGSSRDDVSSFPDDVKLQIGVALWEAQIGGKAAYAKPLKGYGDAGVLEVVDNFDGDTFRAVYTIRFAKAVYVLHAFQKKSKRGIATPKAELDLINRRLQRATEDYKQWSKSKK
jgi:phage-related protein